MRRIAWIGAFLLLAACATALEGQRELSKPSVSVDKERMSAVRLEAPWGGDDAWSYRYPETIQSNKGLLYIDHRLPDGNSQMISALKSEPKWEIDARGRASYEAELENGIVFGGSLAPRDDGTVECEFHLRNGSAVDLRNLNTQLCLVFRDAPGFADKKLVRTYVHSDGGLLRVSEAHPEPSTQAPPPWPVFAVKGLKPLVPGKHRWYVPAEAVDAPFIATESTDGGKLVGIAWENTWKVMSNTQGPCIHADPVIPACAAGESASVRGKIYFFQGTAEELYERCRKDFGKSWDEKITVKQAP